ncbi:MAG TPA: glycosyltransferase family 2 protein [Ignavibacteria bacterium]|nr:glycosyltransferase family 2 protein [Ignavibacteria bacterium]
MNTDNPIVSIVIPTKNRSELLKRSIESVLLQTFQKWEIIVVDDSSIDNTGNVMTDYMKADPRIKYFRIPKCSSEGISEYLNFGITQSKGKYIARLDDDDIWCNRDKLRMQVDFFDSNTEYVLTGGGVIMVDPKGRELFRFFKNETDENIRRKALLACPMEHTTVMFRKDAALKTECYGNYKVAEDWDFFLRLGNAGKLYNFQEYFTYYMQGDHNVSLKDQGEVALTEIKIIKKYRKDYPLFILGYTVHFVQYLYSFLPEFVKEKFQFLLRYLKRNYL